MADFNFKSGFADALVAFIQFKVACGFQVGSYLSILTRFDHFCASRGIDIPVFSREDALEWMKRRNSESIGTHYNRVNMVKHFLTYLLVRGYKVFVVRDVSSKCEVFVPHIYTTEETTAYFQAVDSFKTSVAKDAIQFPVLFRILHCCGTRIGETLSIRKCDVDLQNGVIVLRRTKGGKERYVVVGEDLKVLLKTYAEKCFYAIDDEGLIFTNGRGNRIDPKKIYDAHRQFLRLAGIPYLGGNKGPRVHDWRHHFAVYSFKKMADSGLDMYVALPIMAAYLGHENITATERYIRLVAEHFPSINQQYRDKVKAIFGEDIKNEED